MPAKKINNSRLAELDAQRRMEERQTQRTRRWQQIMFGVISAIVLLSMILSLFINP
jgi:hypothetical protein